MGAKVLHFIDQDLVKDTLKPPQQRPTTGFNELVCEPAKLARIRSSIRIQESTKALGHLVWPPIEVEPSNPISRKLEREEWPREVTQKKRKPAHYLDAGMMPSMH
jgi:hypothetical protein